MKSSNFYRFPFASPSTSACWPDAPLISVVLPVYGQADYLRDAIESVFAACTRYPLEIILVDDGSPIPARSTLRNLLDDSRLRLIEQENTGVAVALNTGFAQANGAFLSWTSADNLYKPNALDRLADFLRANPNVAMTYANVELIDEQGQVLRHSNYRPQDQALGDSSVLCLPFQAETLLDLNDNFINACFLYRRAVLHTVGRYRSQLRGFEDYDYWLRIRLGGQIGRIAHLDSDEVCYSYRLHPNSLTAELDGDALQQQTAALHQRLSDIRRKPLASKNLKVTEVAPQTWRHSSHQEFVLTTESAAALYQVPELDIAAFVPPALQIPPAFRRARDSNYRAVTPAKNSRSILLVFVPDNGTTSECLFLSELIRENSISTFVLLVRTSQQGETAKRIHGLVGAAVDNFRIIDICSDGSATASDTANAAAKSLLYVLSSVNCLLHFPGMAAVRDSLLELRIEATLAATAGRPILSISTADTDGDIIERQLFAELTALPHLGFLAPQQAALPAKFQETLDRLLATEISFCSLDQWLEQVELSSTNSKKRWIELQAGL